MELKNSKKIVDESTPPDIATTILVSLGSLSKPIELSFNFILLVFISISNIR